MWERVEAEGREDLGCWAGKLLSYLRWTLETIYVPKEAAVWMESIGIVPKVAS